MEGAHATGDDERSHKHTGPYATQYAGVYGHGHEHDAHRQRAAPAREVVHMRRGGRSGDANGGRTRDGRRRALTQTHGALRNPVRRCLWAWTRARRTPATSSTSTGSGTHEARRTQRRRKWRAHTRRETTSAHTNTRGPTQPSTPVSMGMDTSTTHTGNEQHQ